MQQLSLAGRQPITDLPQRPRMRQVAIQHRHHLSPTAESSGVPLGSMFQNCLMEGGARDQLQHLHKNARYSIQVEVSFDLVLFLPEPESQFTGASALNLIWTLVVID